MTGKVLLKKPKKDHGGIGRWPIDFIKEKFRDRKKDDYPIVAFHQKLLLPRKIFPVAQDAITSLIEGTPWHLLPGLKHLLLDPLRHESKKSGPRDEINTVDCDVWRVISNDATIQIASEAIKSLQEGNHNGGLEMPFDMAYQCMLSAAHRDEKLIGPQFFFCTISGKTDVYVVVHSTATVTPDSPEIFGGKQYVTQIVNAFKLSSFRIPQGSFIIVPEDSSESTALAQHVRNTPRQLTQGPASDKKQS